MTTKTQEVTPEQRIAILKHLASGKDLDTVAAIMKGISRDAIGEIARHHGWPDKGKLEWAVDVLTKKQEEADQAAIPAGTTEPTVRVPDAALGGRPSTSSPSSITSPTSRPGSGPDEIRILLNTAKGHPSKRIQTAADRVFDHLDKLRALMREDEQKHAARRKAEAEKTAARAEVERLEAQLKEAKAKLRGSTKPAATSSTPKGTAPTGGGLVTTADLDALGVTSKQVRTWAHENDVDCPDVGRLPSRVLEAWKAEHQDGAA